MIMCFACQAAYPFKIWPGHVGQVGFGARRASKVRRVAQDEVKLAASYGTEHISLVHLNLARHAIVGRVYLCALHGGRIDVNHHHFSPAPRYRKGHQPRACAHFEHTAITVPWYEDYARFGEEFACKVPLRVEDRWQNRYLE